METWMAIYKPRRKSPKETSTPLTPWSQTSSLQTLRKEATQSAGLCYSTHAKLIQQSMRLSASTGVRLILDNALYSSTGNCSYKSSHRMPLLSWSNSWLQQHFSKCRSCYLRWVSALRGQALPRLSKAPSRDSSWSSFSFSFSSSFLVVRTPMLSGEF